MRLGTPTASQHIIFDSEKLFFFFYCAPDGDRPDMTFAVDWALTPNDLSILTGYELGSWNLLDLESD